MLKLTRKAGETIMIGDEVRVVMLGVKGNQVKIGIKAPKSVAVHRDEIYNRIKSNQIDSEGNTSSIIDDSF